MEKKNVCSKCKSITTIKKSKINLTIDDVTGESVTVFTRINACPSCKHQEFTKKEKSRLQALTAYYQKELQFGVDEPEEEPEAMEAE